MLGCYALLVASLLASALDDSGLVTTAAAEYTSIQYVGFPVQTGYNGYLGKNKLFYSNANGLGEYVGLDDSDDDIRARLALYKEAVEAALPEVDASSTTLKLFMAPEFFMRGPTGAYDIDDPAFLKIGDAFSEIVSDVKYADWLFVSGSIIGSTLNEKTGLYDTYNMAIVQKGGPSTERVSHFKKYISSIDFLSAQPNQEGAVVYPNMNLGVPLDGPTTMQAVVKQYSHLAGSKAKQLDAKFGVNQGNSSFTMAGITFCLDICLDHGYGVCAAELDEEKAAGVSSGLVQAHLVIAAGSPIEPQNVRVPPGGSAMLCDGLSNGAQHVVEGESRDAQMMANAHRVEPGVSRESLGWDAAVLGDGPHYAVDVDFEGQVASNTVDFMGDQWKVAVNELYAVQKYRGAAVDACGVMRDDVAKMQCYAKNETKPLVYVFDTTPIVALPETMAGVETTA